MRCFLIAISVHCFVVCKAEQIGPSIDTIVKLPEKYIAVIQKKAVDLEQRLNFKRERFLKNIIKHEQRLKEKLKKKSKSTSDELFGDINKFYSVTQGQAGKIPQINQLTRYIPYLDSLSTSIAFLQNKYSVTNISSQMEYMASSENYLKELQLSFSKAEALKDIVSKRQKQLKEQLHKFGLGKAYRKYYKQYYYYKQQIQEYKEILQDRSLIEQKAFTILRNLPAFQRFMQKHSWLATVISLPYEQSAEVNLQGLQNRIDISKLIQSKIDAGGSSSSIDFMRGGIQQARMKIKQLQDKLAHGENIDEELDIAHFKPNTQKTKSFLNRFQLGTNLQSSKANGFFPTTTDIGLSIGYKLNDKGIIGVGGSYKLGWGKDIRHISITHEGLGMRSFIDWKLKKIFWISGGAELNYKSQFKNFDGLKAYSSWQRSGLLGISKSYNLKKKLKGEVKLLWDFLSYQQIPRTQPLIFRFGYSFTK